MTWRLNDIEARQLEERVRDQLTSDTLEIMARRPGISPSDLLVALSYRGYTISELRRLERFL